jgi:hypothetical protein
MKPRARKDDLVLTELPDELLVYDLERHKAHCLNPTAALVFKHCDGRTSVKQIARTLGSELDIAPDEGLVWLSLERLDKARLLEARPAPPQATQRYSRRDLVRRVGLAVATLPVVATVLAPTPAAALASCIPASACIGPGNPPNPCYGTLPASCSGLCVCIGPSTCDPACTP